MQYRVINKNTENYVNAADALNILQLKNCVNASNFFFETSDINIAHQYSTYLNNIYSDYDLSYEVREVEELNYNPCKEIPLNGKLAEVIQFSKTLTPTQISQIQDYLKQKYSL